jgi:beta-lactamase regulating signal transducer with metallopeptidase domain
MGFDLVTVAAHASQWLMAFRAFSQAAAPMAVTALWQSVVLACGLAVCLRLAPRASAAHRFAVWMAGFAAVMALPFLPLLLALREETSGSVGQSLAAAPRPWVDLGIGWSLAIGVLWIAASAARAADLGIHSWRLRRLWKRATPLETDEMETSERTSAWAVELAARCGRRMEVCTTRELDRPSVIGFFRPRVLIPEWLLERLTEKELKQVVLHEAEHLRRRDDWTNLAQKLCLVVFPLNPALAWMERRLCREREMACDEGVVRVTRAPRAYAACLASLAERRMQHRIARRAEALSLGAWRGRPELVERVHRILRRGQGLSPWMSMALMGSLGCGLVAGSVALARCPQLVAFAPAPRLTAQDLAPAPPPLRTDADLEGGHAPAGEAVSGFRAVNTVAEMRTSGPDAARVGRHPARRAAAKVAGVMRPRSIHAETALTAPREELLKAETAPTAGQQWAVLTTWREVETTTAGNGVAPIASAQDQAPDGQTGYEEMVQQTLGTGSGAGAAPRAMGVATSDAPQAQPNAAPGNRITVTRLILRIYSPNPGSSSFPWQPGAFPMGNGWLVIQL